MVLVPALPLAAAVAVAVLGPRLLRSRSHWLVVLALAGSCLASLALLRHVRQQPAGYEHVESYWTWVLVQDASQLRIDPPRTDAPALEPARDFRIDVALRLDALTAIMLAMVTFISLLVAIYSVGYMQGDRGYWRFFAYIAPVRLLDDDAGLGEQLPAVVRVLGSGGRLQLPADRFLVRETCGGGGRHEGVPGEPHRRLWFHVGCVLDLDHLRHVELPRHE